MADPALTTLRLSLSELRFGAAQSLAEALERSKAKAAKDAAVRRACQSAGSGRRGIPLRY